MLIASPTANRNGVRILRKAVDAACWGRYEFHRGPIGAPANSRQRKIALANRVLDNILIAVSPAFVYSPVIDMKGNSGLSLVITQIVGAGACVVSVEGSYDLQTWSTTGITGGVTATTAAASVTTGITQGIFYKYARVKITGNATNVTILNVDVGLIAIG